MNWNNDQVFKNTVGSNEIVFDITASCLFQDCNYPFSSPIPLGVDPNGKTMKIALNNINSGLFFIGDPCQNPWKYGDVCDIVISPNEIQHVPTNIALRRGSFTDPYFQYPSGGNYKNGKNIVFTPHFPAEGWDLAVSAYDLFVNAKVENKGNKGH